MSSVMKRSPSVEIQYSQFSTSATWIFHWSNFLNLGVGVEPRVLRALRPAVSPAPHPQLGAHREVQVALEACSPLLSRESLRRMIARILEDPSLLPEGERELGDPADGEAVPVDVIAP